MQRRDAMRLVTAGFAGATAAEAGDRRASGATRREQPHLVETADGNLLFFKDWGAGRPVLFVHGWALNSDIWEYQMTALAGPEVRCIAYDKRGCGRSSHPGSGFDHDTLADDLAAVIEQLGLRGVTLVGHSMGAGEIARYLSRHGTSRIARAVLVAPITPFALKTPDNPSGVERAVFDATVAELVEDRPRYLAANAPGFFGSSDAVSPEMLQWGVRMALQSSLKASVEMLRSNATTDFRPDLQAFKIPTLIVHGTADLSAPLELTARRTAQGIPGSRLEVYEGAGHGLFLTEKERFNRDLLAFVRG